MDLIQGIVACLLGFCDSPDPTSANDAHKHRRRYSQHEDRDESYHYDQFDDRKAFSYHFVSSKLTLVDRVVVSCQMTSIEARMVSGVEVVSMTKLRLKRLFIKSVLPQSPADGSEAIFAGSDTRQYVPFGMVAIWAKPKVSLSPLSQSATWVAYLLASVDLRA